MKEVRRLMLDMYHLYPPATIAKMTGRAIGTIRVMASAMGLRSGEPEYLLPVERIETACCEFEPLGSSPEESKAGAA